MPYIFIIIPKAYILDEMFTFSTPIFHMVSKEPFQFPKKDKIISLQVSHTLQVGCFCNY